MDRLGERDRDAAFYGYDVESPPRVVNDVSAVSAVEDREGQAEFAGVFCVMTKDPISCAHVGCDPVSTGKRVTPSTRGGAPLASLGAAATMAATLPYQPMLRMSPVRGSLKKRNRFAGGSDSAYPTETNMQVPAPN